MIITRKISGDCRQAGELDLTQPSRPPLRYHGGKWRIAPWIISHFPKPEILINAYVEVFGGAAGVLFRKQRHRIEVYNDLDSQVFNFFKVLRDPGQTAELIRLVDLTPFCREEFDLAYKAVSDPVESARRFACRTFFGHGTSSMDPRDSNGFRSCDIRAGKSYAREWVGIPKAISDAADRLRGVTIENVDFRRLVPKFNSPTTLLYVDPPYPLSTRSNGGKGYVHEMTMEEHRQLHWMLSQSDSKIAISGYRCETYDQLYSDWNKQEKLTSANGQRGAVPRTEVLWMNY